MGLAIISQPFEVRKFTLSSLVMPTDTVTPPFLFKESAIAVEVIKIATAQKSEKSQEIAQAVMKTELAALTREVRAHNHFAQIMPVVEEQIKVINHRLADLEGGR